MLSEGKCGASRATLIQKSPVTAAQIGTLSQELSWPLLAWEHMARGKTFVAIWLALAMLLGANCVANCAFAGCSGHPAAAPGASTAPCHQHKSPAGKTCPRLITLAERAPGPAHLHTPSWSPVLLAEAPSGMAPIFLQAKRVTIDSSPPSRSAPLPIVLRI